MFICIASRSHRSAILVKIFDYLMIRYVWQKCGILENSDADLAYKKLSLPERNFLLGEGKGTEALIEQLEHASIKSKAGVLFSKIKMVMQNRRWNQENDNPMFEPNRKLFLELHKLDAVPICA